MATLTIRRVRECAAAVLTHARLQDIHVVHMETQGTHPIIDGPFSVDTTISVMGGQREGAIDARSRYKVEAKHEDGAAAWSVQLDLVGVWAIPEAAPDFDGEALSSFALAIGTMTLHPFARETVQTEVSRLGYPPFTMEMITPPTGGNDDVELEVELDADG